MVNTLHFVLSVCFIVLVGCRFDVSALSFLQDVSSVDYTARPASGVRSYSEERFERKKIGLFDWASTPNPYPTLPQDQGVGLSSRPSRTTTQRSFPWNIPTERSATRLPSRDRTYSEERLEAKEIGWFGWTTTTTLNPYLDSGGSRDERRRTTGPPTTSRSTFADSFPERSATRLPSRDRTYSEERLEAKEIGWFGWTTTTTLNPYLDSGGSRDERPHTTGPPTTSRSTFADSFPERSATRLPSRDRTYSEERLEAKEIGWFGWTTTTTLNPYLDSGGSRDERPRTTGPPTSRSTFADSFPGSKKEEDVDRDGGSSSDDDDSYMGQKWMTTLKPLVKEFSSKRQKKQESKAQTWCKKYEQDCVSRKSQSVSEDLKNRIIGGRTAIPKKHTYMVLIGYGSLTDRQWLCGGSLISERYVLSAAHCVRAGFVGRAKWARVGELDLSTANDDARPQDKNIVETIVHPKYKEPAVYNDIVLFKLESEVNFDEWVSPICLHTSKTLPDGRVTVAGWGRVDFASNTSPMLLAVDIKLFNESECQRLMGHTDDKMRLPRGIDTDTMVCAGDIRGGKDSCTGDSGGPLFYEEGDCSTIQVGITSIGKDCGLPNTAGIYTNVNKYLSWIESTVWGDL